MAKYKRRQFTLNDRNAILMLEDIRKYLENDLTLGKMNLANAARYCIAQIHRNVCPEKYKEQEENALLH